MSNLRVDYSDLRGLVDEGKKQSEERRGRRARLRTYPLRAARVAAIGFY